MDHKKELSGLALPNYGRLRAQCLQRFWAEVKHPQQVPAPFSLDECMAISELFQAATARYRGSDAYDGPVCKDGTADWRWNEGFRIIQRDLDELAHLPDDSVVPKWQMLAGWLLPESASGSCPEFVAQLATACLRNTLVPY